MALVRIVLIDGGSVIANWDPIGIAGRGPREDAGVTLTSEEAVDRLPPGSVEAILPLDRAVPIPGWTAIYRFATLA